MRSSRLLNIPSTSVTPVPVEHVIFTCTRWTRAAAAVAAAQMDIEMQRLCNADGSTLRQPVIELADERGSNSSAQRLQIKNWCFHDKDGPRPAATSQQRCHTN